MRKVLRNLRGLRALVVQGDVTGRDVLVRTLGKLGMEVRIAEPVGGSPETFKCADLVFIDADEGIEPIFGDEGPPDVPVIAIIGSEAPSRLSRVVRVRAASHIQKPVRNTGVFTATLLAINEHAERQRSAREAAALRRRFSGRKKVVKAVVTLMRRWGIDEEEAYQELRSAAMRDRVPIEEAAERVLGGSTEPSPDKRCTGSLD